MIKRSILCIIAILTCIGMYSQPKGMGVRVGVTGIDASYQQKAKSKNFVQVDLGMDLGYNINGRPGVKAAVTYDFIWAEPAWTARGTWSLYSGPGISLGFVDDIVPYEIDKKLGGYQDNGFMIGAHIDIGLEYTLTIPISIAFNVRPCFGLHVNDGKFRDRETGLTVNYGGKTGFYDNGLLGFVPSLSIRYCF